jgi:hypothetical protein
LKEIRGKTMRITDLSTDFFKNLGSSESEKITGGVTVTAPQPIIEAVENPGKDIPGLGPGTPSFESSPVQPVQIPSNLGTSRAVDNGALRQITFY